MQDVNIYGRYSSIKFFQCVYLEINNNNIISMIEFLQIFKLKKNILKTLRLDIPIKYSDPLYLVRISTLWLPRDKF